MGKMGVVMNKVERGRKGCVDVDFEAFGLKQSSHLQLACSWDWEEMTDLPRLRMHAPFGTYWNCPARRASPPPRPLHKQTTNTVLTELAISAPSISQETPSRLPKCLAKLKMVSGPRATSSPSALFYPSKGNKTQPWLPASRPYAIAR